MSSGQTVAPPGLCVPLLEGLRGWLAGCEDALAEGLIVTGLPSSALRSSQLKGKGESWASLAQFSWLTPLSFPAWLSGGHLTFF